MQCSGALADYHSDRPLNRSVGVQIPIFADLFLFLLVSKIKWKKNPRRNTDSWEEKVANLLLIGGPTVGGGPLRRRPHDFWGPQ